MLSVFIAILTAVLYGLTAVLKKILFNNTKINSMTFTTYELLFQTIISSLLFIIILSVDILEIKYTLLLFIAGFLFGVALYIYNMALHKEDTTRVTQLSSLEVVTTPIFAFILLGESVGHSSLVGVTLIIIGIFVLTIEKESFVNIDSHAIKYAFVPVGIALVAWGIEDVIMKYALETKHIFYVYFIVRSSGFITIFLINVLTPRYRKNISKTYEYIRKKQLSILEKQLIIVIPSITSTTAVMALIVYSEQTLITAVPILGAYPLFSIIFLYIIQKRYDIISKEEKEPIRKRVVSFILFLTGIIIII